MSNYELRARAINNSENKPAYKSGKGGKYCELQANSYDNEFWRINVKTREDAIKFFAMKWPQLPNQMHVALTDICEAKLVARNEENKTVDPEFIIPAKWDW